MRFWIIAIVITLAVGGIAFAVHKIDETGYNRCKTEQAAAAAAQKDDARGNIVESGKKHEEVKKTIKRESGPNDRVGPRVTTAIDSLP